MSKKVLVYETLALGHRGYYAQVLSAALIQSGFDVTLAIPETELNSPEGLCTVKQLLPDVHWLPIDFIHSDTDRGRAQLRFQQLQSIVHQLKPDHVYVPTADGLTQVWGAQWRPDRCFPKGTIMEGLVMRTPAAYPASSKKVELQRWLNKKLLSRSGWDRMHLLDPISYLYMLDHSTDSFAKRLRLLPEATEPFSIRNRTDGLKCLGLDGSNDLIVTCPGEIHERKGTDLLIRAFDLARPASARLILVGRHSPEIQSMLKSDFKNAIDDQRIISIDRFATDDEFASLFAIADVVATPYNGHMGSSSILIRAAAAGKRILSSNWGWCGWATSNFRLGEICNVNNLSGFTSAIKNILSTARTENTGIDTASNSAVSDFLRYHTLENHLAHWLDLIQPSQTSRELLPFPFPSQKVDLRLGVGC